MKTSWRPSFLPFLMAFLFCLPAAARAEIVDRVVAVVNNDIITLRDLNEAGEPLFKRILREAPAGQAEEALRRARQELLSALIDKKLIEQRAAAMAITVSEKELAAALEQILDRNQVNREQFLQELRLNDLTEEQYRDQLRTQILQSKLIGYEVRSRIVVTEEKVRTYYRQHFTGQHEGDGYRILQIGFAWDPEGGRPTPEEAERRAEQVREQALAGENFQELARVYSDLPSARDGGEIGVFNEEEMAPYMRQVIAGLKPGEISRVVRTDSGFQFFKLLSVKQGDMVRQAGLESVKDEIRERIYEEESQEQLKTWLKELRDEAYIKKLL